MRTTRVHCPNVGPDPFRLPPGASRRVARALRMRVGEQLICFDGSGVEWLCRIESIDRSEVHARGVERQSVQRESPLALWLAVGLSRGERMDLSIQKATELGAHGIIPLASQYSEVRLAGDRLAKRLTHWRGVAVAACEQCGRSVLPSIVEPIDVAPVGRPPRAPPLRPAADRPEPTD